MLASARKSINKRENEGRVIALRSVFGHQGQFRRLTAYAWLDTLSLNRTIAVTSHHQERLFYETPIITRPPPRRACGD
jgi:hypothetical protein